MVGREDRLLGEGGLREIANSEKNAPIALEKKSKPANQNPER